MTADSLMKRMGGKEKKRMWQKEWEEDGAFPGGGRWTPLRCAHSLLRLCTTLKDNEDAVGQLQAESRGLSSGWQAAP